MKIILCGAPGAGKGTQAEYICDVYQIPAISTGNILRRAIAEGTEIGKLAKEYTEFGRLVPDEIVIGIMKERLNEPDCRNGFLLDGFPRTLPQAEALDRSGVEIDLLLSIEVPDGEIETRMSGRRVCPDCGASFHIRNNPPVEDGVCDKCGTALRTRADDAPEKVKERLRIYHEQTEPVKDYYRAGNKLKEVDGTGSVPEAATRIRAILED